MNLDLQSICLIGGTGYLGAAMRKLFHSKFKTLVTFGRKQVMSDLYPNELYYNISSLSSGEIYKILYENKTIVVVDLAYSTVPKSSFDNPVQDFSDNLLLVNKHLEAVKELSGVKYVYVSSGGTVYGNSVIMPLNESQPNFPLSPYGITKMACERYVNMYHHVHALNTVIVRPSNIYGPGQVPFTGQGFIATAMASAYKSEYISVFGDGSQVRDYIYIGDFCTGMLDIIQFGKDGEIYNIGSGKGTAITEVVYQINELTLNDNMPLLKTHLPERKFDVKYNVLDTRKLYSLNGWQMQTPLDHGLSLTWDWIKDYMSKIKD